jgi:hypothetical protein
MNGASTGIIVAGACSSHNLHGAARKQSGGCTTSGPFALAASAFVEESSNLDCSINAVMSGELSPQDNAGAFFT